MARCLTFLFLLAVMPAIGYAQDQISEILGNPPGLDPDTQEVELLGTPGAAFDLWLVSIESDPGANQGTVDRAENVTGTYDANGRAVVTIADLENPSNTLVLCDNFTGTIGTTDVDTDDDGMIDDSSTIVGFQDAISIIEDVDDPGYGTELGGDDFIANGNSSDPLIVFRDGTTGTWYAVDTDLMVYDTSGAVVTGTFDLDPTISTFGSVNPSLDGVVVDCTLGDVDRNGVVSFSDIAPFITLLTVGGFQCEADCDESGEVNFSDISVFIGILVDSGS